MIHKIKRGELLVLTAYTEDECECKAVVKALRSFNMAKIAAVAGGAGAPSMDFIRHMEQAGLVKRLKFKELPFERDGSLSPFISCEHKQSRFFIIDPRIGPFGMGAYRCLTCWYLLSEQVEATEEQYLECYPTMRSEQTGRKMTDEEYAEHLRKAIEARNAEIKAFEAQQVKAVEDQLIAMQLDDEQHFVKVLELAGIVPHAGCTGTLDDIEVSASGEAEFISTVMHHDRIPGVFRCKKCGKKFSIA